MKKVLLLAFATTFAIGCFAANRTDTAITVNATRHPLFINLPDSYTDTVQYPMVIGVHYCGGTADQFLKAMQKFADSLKVVVACPDYFSGRIPDKDSGVFKIVVDSVRSLFTIDTNEVYLTAMSCNSDYALQQGLKKAYPFKGIFPWAPWVSGSSAQTYNYNSPMPTVISIGTNDQKLKPVLAIYDSLKAHHAEVNLILEPNIGHTLSFAGFDDVMLRSYAYLNDTGDIAISTIEDIEMYSDSTYKVAFDASSKSGQDLIIRTYSSHPNIVPQASIAPTSTESQYSFTLSSTSRTGTVVYVVEAMDQSGKSIAQSTFKAKVSALVGTKDEAGGYRAALYPNPAQDLIHFDNAPAEALFQIINLQGTAVYSSKINPNGNKLPPFLHQGTYMVNVTTENSSESLRLIIK